MRRWLLIYILPFTVLLFNPYLSDSALACSGCVGCTWMDIENDLGENTIVVRGSGVRNQDSATVFVAEYLVGEPDYPYLRVFYFGNGHNNAARIGYYIGSCGSGAKYPSDEEAYYVMTRQQDGTYRINHIISFPSETHQFTDTSIHWDTYSLSEEEFLERINANPQPPLFMDREFPPGPLFSPVLILTENNSLYLLPVDARTGDDIVFIVEDVQQMQTIDTFISIITDDKIILHEILSGFQWAWDYPEGVDCLMIDCITFSDNGVIMMRQVDADTIQVCELALIYPNSNYVSGPTAERHPCVRDTLPLSFYDGAGVRFSADSNHMAIWRNDQITVYGGLYWVNNLLWEREPIIVASTTLDIPTEADTTDGFAGRGIWTQDSRWLAYSDAQGLWLWDVFTQAPHLFLSTQDAGAIPYARFFSESGRYLAVSVGDEHFIMDRFSHLIFPDGIIRPDDRMMIRNDTVNHMPVPAETCSLLDGQCSPLVEADPMPYIRNAGWRASYYPDEWVPCYVIVKSTTELQGSNPCRGIHQTGEYTIILNNFYRDINAEDTLSSPIKSLIVLSRN